MTAERRTFISAVMGELSRRRVLRTVGGYAVAVFVVLQLMDAAVEPLLLPDWFPTLVVIVLILGFPLVFVLAWQFDITGQGLRRTEPAGLLSRGQSFFLFSLMFALTAGLGLAFYQYYSGLFVAAPDETAAVAPTDRDFSAPENSIAVLPFTDLSEAGDQASFSDGMTEEILNLLAQVDGLHVAARTSSFAFRNPQVDIREIGRALNVATVLEGSLRTAGDRIRLTAQLINVEDGYHIWSQTYDRELTDVFALQDEVASAIATELVDSFEGLAEKPPTRTTTNLQAFEAYRTGRLHWWRRSPQELQRAIELFAEALEHDPDFAPAYAAIADSWILLSLYANMDIFRAIDRAMPMIEKALALDPESAEAFAALGLARMEIDQLDSAESALRHAVGLNEDYIPAQLWLAGLLGNQGRLPEQGLVLQDAMARDPLNELLAINYAYNLNARGEQDEARALLTDLALLKPDSANLTRTLSGLVAEQGDLVSSWRYARQAYELEPESPLVIQSLAGAWLRLGDTERAVELLQEGMSLAEDNRDLKSEYFKALLIDGRLEEARQVIREIFGDEVESLPGSFQRFYHHLMGLVSILDGQFELALTEFEQSLALIEARKYDGDHMFALTMSSYLFQQMGDPDRAAERLEQAEKQVQRARVNGLDTANLYYTESIINLLRDQEERAVESLQAAYDRGWRDLWVLGIDGRLQALRDQPAFLELEQRMAEDLDRALAQVRGQTVASL